MDKIKDFQAFGEADDTAVSKEAWLDSARACKKPGGLCFDFDYCEENFKLVGSIFFENRESFVDNILSDSHCNHYKGGMFSSRRYRPVPHLTLAMTWPRNC